MQALQRYTTMVFPQGFDGSLLKVNIVLIPRNQDPFLMQLPAPNSGATAFADLVPEFELKIVKGLDEWPVATATSVGQAPVPYPVNVVPAVNKKALLNALKEDFGERINFTDADKAPKVEDTATLSVNKYLPESYRNAFNFTSPRNGNAKIDDSYHCAVRKPVQRDPDFKNDNRLSWGQVFAHILRQPMLARACGMIYETSITITAANKELFEKGSYLYADIINTEYRNIQEQAAVLASGPFIKPYAARIPRLKMGAANARPVFAPILFPVLYQTGVIDPEPPKAPWDEIFAELNEYNDGFAKIVHASQPVSSELLAERPNGSHPVKDDGIRLAWDDEQLLTWYMRQLEGYRENPADPGPGERIDAPLGVYGYRVDVQKDDDSADWESLNLVQCNARYRIGGIEVNKDPNQLIELPYQVFPSQIDNDKTAPFWLPMYYTAWTGKNLVLKDTDAIAIYQNDQAVDLAEDGTVRRVENGNLFQELPLNTKLLYGERYRFRVRMMDISGGGPVITDELYNNVAAHYSEWSFKRYVAPALCRIPKPELLSRSQTVYYNELIGPGDVHSFDANPVLKIRRPLLGYPAVVFTNKYQQAVPARDPVQLLIQSVQEQKALGTEAYRTQIHPGIADPDVTRLQVKVEVETLRLDNLASESGRENYLTLYSTLRSFPSDFEGELELPVRFMDVPVLRWLQPDDPFDLDGYDLQSIHNMNELPLPTARKIRVTLRAVCGEAEGGDQAYYGVLDETNQDLDSRFGKTTQLMFYKPSVNESDLLLPKANIPRLQAIYLQPDPVQVRKGLVNQQFFFSEMSTNQPDIMQRLASQLGLKVKGLTLVARKGERVVFGCNSKIRHQLAPDGSSISFSTKGDLCDHWIGAVTYKLNRDWTWDALEDVAFTVGRTKKFKTDAPNEEETRAVLGDIELKHSASFESLLPDTYGQVNRQETTIIFIDAIEPKSLRTIGNTDEPRFPDELEVVYKLIPNFKAGHGGPAHIESEVLRLPTTVNPKQVPKISSVGLAFSKYRKGEKYSSTEPRQRYLWVELEEPVRDPHDTLFCRVLHYAPDQLIGNNRQKAEIDQATEDTPPLPIDPEYIRVITPNQSDDMAGLGAMQAMEKATGNDDLHYLLPLPPGLHPESPELFGFFTYEFRIGHGHWSQGEKENLWSTAQGRFGRPLSITGMQHPAPTLLCNVTRDDHQVKVNAPYAKAVWQGRNVTSDPPRTQLFAVLYAQVIQADREEYRNILIDTRLMNLVKPVPPVRDKPHSSSFGTMTVNAVMEAGHLWTVGQTDEVARAQVVLSNMAVLNEVSKLEVDKQYQRQVNRAVSDYKKGKTVKMDQTLARNVLAAYDSLANKSTPPLVSAGAQVTTASVLAGQILASYKDLTKTAAVSWSNKEIAFLLEQMGLPEDAALSVLVVEVFGNITNILEHVASITDEVLEQVSKRAEGRDVAAMILERRRRNREALTAELGNYRILRTSPLTAVPFVCCATC